MDCLNRRTFLTSLGAACASTASTSIARNADPMAVFRVDDFTELDGQGRHGGMDDLLSLMGRHGYAFYQSDVAGALSSSNGLIARDDVVMLKINAQWDRRGMTNVDVVQGVIKAILAHPDGFDGEIVIVENAQFRRSDFPSPDGNAFNWQRVNNAEDRNRTFEIMANEMSREGRVSCYDWTNLPQRHQWDEDDHETQAYFRPDRIISTAACYPRFTTDYGTRINFKEGIWTGDGYDAKRLKLINIPVLKDHFIYNVTACVKNYMGVVLQYYHDTFVRDCGIMMTTTRPADLHILDGVYVGISNGPGVGDAGARREGILMAGLDPVSVDYYAAKHVLSPLSGSSRHNPDASTPFHQSLVNAQHALAAVGRPTAPELSEEAYRLITKDTEVTSSAQAWTHYGG